MVSTLKQNSNIDKSRSSTKLIVSYALAFIFIDLISFAYQKFLTLSYMEGSSIIWLVILSWLTVFVLVLAPLLGGLSDNTRDPMGRRKPWLINSSVIMVVLITLLFLLNIFPLSLFSLLIIIIIGINLAITIFTINTRSLFSEMFMTFEKRIRANSILQGLFVIFEVIFLWFNLNFHIAFFHDNPLMLIIVFGLILSIALIAVLIFFKSGFQERKVFLDDPKISIKKSFRNVLKNRDFLLLLGIQILIPLSYTLTRPIIGTPIYGQYIYENMPYLRFISRVMEPVSLLVSILLWKSLSDTRDIKKNLKTAIGFLIISALPLSFLSPIFVIPLIIINSVGRAAFRLYLLIFISSIIDSDEISTGVRNDGTYFGFFILFGILSSLLFLPIQTISFMFSSPSMYNPEMEYDILNFFEPRFLIFFIICVIILFVTFLLLKKISYTSDKIKEIDDRILQVHKEKYKQSDEPSNKF